jgi:hypothetical protein
MNRYLSLLVIFHVFTVMPFAQSLRSDSLHLSGIVLQSPELIPVSRVHVIVGDKLTITDEEGRFYLWARTNDTLRFTHISFRPVSWTVPDTLNHNDLLIGLFLTADTTFLEEVVIYPRIANLSLMATRATREEEEMQLASSNLRTASWAARKTRQSEWDASKNQEFQMQKYHAKAEYRGMIPQDEILPITAIIPLALGLVRQIYNNSNQEQFRITPAERELIERIYLRNLQKP